MSMCLEYNQTFAPPFDLPDASYPITTLQRSTFECSNLNVGLDGLQTSSFKLEQTRVTCSKRVLQLQVSSPPLSV
jgi:hypothetical protein